MTLPQQVYLAMVLIGFTLFFVTLMAVWIGTRGWAARPLAAAQADHDPHLSSPPLKKAA